MYMYMLFKVCMFTVFIIDYGHSDKYISLTIMFIFFLLLSILIEKNSLTFYVYIDLKNFMISNCEKF